MKTRGCFFVFLMHTLAYPVLGSPPVIELALGLDLDYISSFQGSACDLTCARVLAVEEAKEITNKVVTFYKSFEPPIGIGLTEIVFPNENATDFFKSSTTQIYVDQNSNVLAVLYNTAQVLNRVQNWKYANFDSIKKHDVFMLLTGINLNQSVGAALTDGICDRRSSEYVENVTRAYIDGGLCINTTSNDVLSSGCYSRTDSEGNVSSYCCGTEAISSVGVVLGTDFDIFDSGSIVRASQTTHAIAVTLAHEIGHTLGFVHDTTPGYIMAAVAKVDATADTFSSDTEALYDTRSKLEDDPFRCLRYTSNFTCGNGVIEDGEDCDEDSACCVECRYKGQCLVSEGACCDPVSCLFRSTDYACVDAELCQYASMCTSNSATCAPPSLWPYGTICEGTNGDRGSCWEGACLNYNTQCAIMANYFTSTEDIVGSSACWDFPSENSVRTAGPDFDCGTEDVLCFMSSSDTICEIKGTHSLPTSTSPVSTGFPCGDPTGSVWSKVCLHSSGSTECVDLQNAIEAVDNQCIGITCSNNGYCIRGVCVCETQWSGANCQTVVTCRDGEMNNGETDIDCGVGDCKCGAGLTCSTDDNCKPAYTCTSGSCRGSVEVVCPDNSENNNIGGCDCDDRYGGTLDGETTCQYYWGLALSAQDNACVFDSENICHRDVSANDWRCRSTSLATVASVDNIFCEGLTQPEGCLQTDCTKTGGGSGSGAWKEKPGFFIAVAMVLSARFFL